MQSFTCTTPVPRSVGAQRPLAHPKPWELGVQAALRNLKPPAQEDEVLLFGLDGNKLAAVVWVWLNDKSAPRVVKILAVAVACSHRGQGGALADEALEVAILEAGDRSFSSGVHEVIVVAWVEGRNDPSQRMCQRTGFAKGDDVGGGLSEWTLVLEGPEPA